MSLSGKDYEPLEDFLNRKKVSKEEFHKLGRPTKKISKLRSEYITSLHKKGLTWNEMAKVSGMSIGAIARNTKAKGCKAAKENRIKNAIKIAKSRKGEKKPWLSVQMKKAWKQGKFDFHKGRKLSSEEVQKLKDSWTKERRKKRSLQSKKLWQKKEYRKKLMNFHTSKEERERRSEAQTRRMIENPEIYSSGNCEYRSSKKCLNKEGDFLVRSSYEAKMVDIINQREDILSFEYEKRFTLDNGRWILPDFILYMDSGEIKMVEVKSEWVLDYPDSSKLKKRLKIA